MRKLSKLFYHLSQRLGRVRESELPEASEERIKLIGEFGRLASPVFIPGILELLAHPDPRTAAAAADAISRRLQQTSATGLRQLEQSMRGGWFDPGDWGGYAGRNKLVTAAFVRAQELPPPVLAALTFHRDGYVREAALRKLRDVRDGSELPFIVLRWNDWVDEIRRLAEELLRKRLRPDYADHWFAAMPLVRAVTEGQRNENQGRLLDEATALARTPEARPALRRALDAPDRFVRRAAAEVAWSTDDEDRLALLRRTLSDPDAVVRSRATKLAAATLDDPELDKALSTMIGDPLVWIRREALYATLKRRPDRAPALLERLLLDRHPSMRHAARVYLRDLRPLDAAAWYRRQIGELTGPALVAALGGLGETGKPEDAAVVLPLTTHAQPRVRAAAAQALGKLDGEHQVSALLALLQDAHPAPAHAARDALVRQRHLLDPSVLLPLLDPARPAHVRCDAVRVLREVAGMAALAPLIRLAADPEATVARAARAGLERPACRTAAGWIRVDDAAVAAARTAYEDTRDRLPPEVQGVIERWLRSLKS